MAIDVSSVQHNGGFLPDMILLTLLYVKELFLSLQPMIPPKRFDISPPCLEDAQKV